MNSPGCSDRRLRLLEALALVLAWAISSGLAELPSIAQHPNISLWDTLSPIGDPLGANERSDWKAVPNDLLMLEKDPAKASSDPGYYGRDYSFRGDAVVETRTLTAVFWSAKGHVVFYSKGEGSRLGVKVLELGLLEPITGSNTLSHLEVLRNADDEVALRASFSQTDSPETSGSFVFDRSGIVEIRPAGSTKSVRLWSSLKYGVVPSFVGDDLIFGGSEAAGTNGVWVPCENLFLGLLAVGDNELVMTWPNGKQRMRLNLGGRESEQGVVESIDFDTDGRAFYLSTLSAPGIWHEEKLTPDYLEKDVASQWKRPFPAKWKTQLFEEEVKTTFTFRDHRGEIWRGVPGSYNYPVWFEGDQAFYRLGKKVAPKGVSVVYCLEGRDTPPAIITPVDVLRETLGRQACEPILDIAGRKLRTHHRRGGDGVHRACTCGCTEAIQAVFEAGDEVSQKDYVQGALDDMIYFVHRHVERIDEYRKFADEVSKTIETKRAASPGLKSFLDSLEEIAQQIPQEYEVQKENMKSFRYADELARKTMALTTRNDTNNVKAYLELLKSWREMGGAQDYVLAKCHTIARKLDQAAGYGCASQPEAVPVAEEIRARCRACLRNPDGYEVWADY